MKRITAYALALAIGLLTSACSSDLGKRCTRDSDCDSPLQCALIEEAKGVCSYGEPPEDASPPEVATE